MLLWEKDNSRAACKVGIAGDFLPAGALTLPSGATWADMSRHLAKQFEDLDVAFVNLECPLNVDESKAKMKLGLGASFSAPDAALDFLAPLRTKVVSLANNHIYDYGPDGLQQTQHALQSRGLISLGAGKTLKEQPETYVWESAAGVRVGFWAAARGLPELASTRTSGVEPATTKRAAQALAMLHEKAVHLRVALVHTGLEHTNRPDPGDVLLMDALAGMGFDAVGAAHSHRISGHRLLTGERARHACCFYGLGSMTSGILYSPLEREGILAVLSLDRHGALLRVEARPIYLAETGWGTSAAFSQLEAIERRFVGLSREIADGSYKNLFYRDTNKGLFQRQLRDIRMAFQNGGIPGIARKLGRLRLRHIRRVLRNGLAMFSQFRNSAPVTISLIQRADKS